MNRFLYLIGLIALGFLFFNMAYSQASLVSPKNNSRIITSSVSFSWDPDPDADSYILEVSTDESSLASNQISVAGTSYNNYSITATSTYYWCVVSVIAGEQSNSSNTYSFIPFKITSISPSSGPSGAPTSTYVDAPSGGQEIIISGYGFGSDEGIVLFPYCPSNPNYKTVKSDYIDSWQDNLIKCYVPHNASSGIVVIQTDDNFSSSNIDNSAQYNVSFGYNGCVWTWPQASTATSVLYYFDPGNYLYNSKQTLQTYIDTAALAWNKAGANFKFSTGGKSSSSGYVYIGPVPADPKNPNGPIPNASTSMVITDGIISGGNTVISNTINFDNNGTELQSIMTHEFGHWLALNDLYGANDASKTMYGYYNGSTGLTPNDKAGIIALYGRNTTGVNPVGPPPPPPPYTPKNFTATISGLNVVLTWDTYTGNGSLEIFKNGVLLSGLSPTITSYTDVNAVTSLPATYEIYGINSNGVSSAPSVVTVLPAPIANPASNITSTSFTANWGTVSGATKYFLDATISDGWNNLLPAYNNLDVSNVTSYPVTGLSPNTIYRYRVRSSNGVQSPNSNTITVTTTPAPAITVNPTSLSFGSVIVNTTSSQQTYTVTGANLSPASGNITITAPSGFQISTTSGSGFASSITVAYNGGALASTTVYVRFTPTAITSYSGNITTSGGGATTQNVAVSGTGIQAPSLSTSPTSIGFGNVVINTSSDNGFTLFGSGLSPTNAAVTITAPSGFQVSTTSGSGFAPSLTVTAQNGGINVQGVYVRFTPTAVQSYSGNITISGGGATTNVGVSGSGIAVPTISLNPASLCVDYGSGSTSVTISNSGGGTLNWSVTSSDPSWLTINPSSGTNNGTITVNYTTNTSASPRSGTITVSGTSATNTPQTVNVTQKASPPTVSMSFSPESGTQVGSANVTIHYSVNQPASVSIYVDWLYSSGDYLSGSNQWTTTLSAGTHTIYIYAGNNNGGNSVSETYNVLYPPPPSIDLSVYPSGTNSNYTVEFSVNSSNQQISTDLYVDNSIYCSWQNMGCNDLFVNVYLAPGTTHQILVRSTNNYGAYNEAYATVDVPNPPPPPAPTVYITGINQDGINGYGVYFYVESGNQPVSITYYVDGNIINGCQSTGGLLCTYIYLEAGTHEICFYVQNTYGNNEACTSIEVLPPAYPAPTISQFVTSLTTYGTVIVSFYVDSDNQPVDIKLYYGNSYDEWQNTGGYISDEISAASIPDNILDVEVSNAYGQNEQTVCPLESKPGSIAAHKPIVLKESSVSGTTNSNGNFVKKNVDILSSKSASFNSSNNATSTLSGGSSIVVTSNKNLPRKNIINILSANVKKDVASNQIGTYTVMREIIEHTWDIKSNQDKKAFISLECPSLDIQSNKGNQKAVKFKNDIQDKNASFDMGISKGDTISTRFKISYSHLNAFGIKMSKGIEFKITVDANGSNGTYQASIKEPLSGQETDSLGIARLDNAIKWVVPKDMKSVRIVPSITENIIDSSLKVNIVYEIISSQDSIGKNQASLGKGVQIYQETKVEIPTVFAASQNYPNPFNPSTVIRYQLPAASFVKLVVYDIMGREVAILAEGMKNTGYYTSTFDGSRFASGIYFARLTAMPQDGSHPFVKVMKMSMMK
ncbi:MAG: BACON domain-containing carbohydrate-binding protein [Bacteroidota bacterium]|jgi:hypothetical protein